MAPAEIRAVFHFSNAVVARAVPAASRAQAVAPVVRPARVVPVAEAVLVAEAAVADPAVGPLAPSVKVARAVRRVSQSARSVKSLKCRRRRP